MDININKCFAKVEYLEGNF